MRAMAGRLQRLARRAGWHLAPVSEYQLLKRTYYSPLSDLDALPAEIWDRRSAMAGIAFDTEAQIDWAETELAPFTTEFEAPHDGTWGSGEYYYANKSFEWGDADVAYAMVRHLQPRRILELGSGFSTLVLDKAVERNGTGELVSNDPFPRGVVPERLRVEQRGAESVPLSEFEALQPGDILFVDTTHTVKLGSEVNYIVLDALPALRPGVVVHFHDIYLPYEYPRGLVEFHDAYWAEQYLLQAFLAMNPGYEVLFANNAVAREQRERFKKLVPSYTGDNIPNGIRLRRV